MNGKKKVKIENWYIFSTDNNEFRAPELKLKRLGGNVYNHPNFNDGAQVSTSNIVNINLEEKLVETRNTCYLLGKPDKDYADKYNLTQYGF